MVIEQQKKQFQVTGNDIIKASLSADISTFTRMLAEHFYSNPIESIVRELASNGYDAHIRANNTKDAVVVKVGYDDLNQSYFFGVKDRGTGMSEDTLRNVYMTYGDSDKRNSNKELGARGLGSKSPYAYTDTFFIETCKDGKMTKGIMSYDAHYVPSLIITEKTEHHEDGTYVYFFIQEGDIIKFLEACCKQLIFFENVYLDCDLDYNIVEDFNNATIHDAGLYKTTSFPFAKHGLGMDEYMILLGDVLYPLSNTYSNTPIAIKFGLDSGIIPNPPRESIVKDTNYDSIVTSTFEAAKDQFLLDLDSHIVDREISLCDFIKNPRELKDNYIEFFNIENFFSGKYGKAIKIKVKGFETINNWRNLRDLVSSLYTSKYYYWCSRREQKSISITSSYDKHKMLSISKQQSTLKDKYVKDQLNDSTLYHRSKLTFRQMRKLFNVNYRVKNIRELVENAKAALLEFEKEFFIDYDAIDGSDYKEVKNYTKRKYVVYEKFRTYKSLESSSIDDLDFKKINNYLFFKEDQEQFLFMSNYFKTNRYNFWLTKSKKTYVDNVDKFKELKMNRHFRKVVTQMFIVKDMLENDLSFDINNLRKIDADLYERYKKYNKYQFRDDIYIYGGKLVISDYAKQVMDSLDYKDHQWYQYLKDKKQAKSFKYLDYFNFGYYEPSDAKKAFVKLVGKKLYNIKFSL